MGLSAAVTCSMPYLVSDGPAVDKGVGHVMIPVFKSCPYQQDDSPKVVDAIPSCLIHTIKYSTNVLNQRS